MYYYDYKKHPDAKLNPKLLWEHDLNDFDYHKMRSLVVERVIERGWPEDWYFILNRYGVENIREVIKQLPFLNRKDLTFVSHQFDIPLSSIKCYEKKRSVNLHWNS